MGTHISKTLGEIEGSWVDQIQIEGWEYWSSQNAHECKMLLVDHPLPSDCHFWEDLICLMRNDLPNA